MSIIDWDDLFREFRRIMLVCPETWKCASMDDATVRQVWEEELDQSEKDWIATQYRRWEHELDPPMAIVRWRAAVRPFTRSSGR